MNVKGAIAFFVAVITVLVLISIVILSETRNDVIVERSVYEDQSGQLTFPDVQSETFTTFKGLLNRGYSHSTFWVRLKIMPPSADRSYLKNITSNRDYVLRIRPSYLDSIELFDPEEPLRTDRLVGMKYFAQRDELHTFNFNFVLHNVDHPRTIWLKINTASTVVLLANALTVQQLYEADTIQLLTYGFYSAFFILSFFIAIYIYSIYSNRLVGVFAFKQVTQLIWIFVDFGFARYFFSNLPFDLTFTDIRIYPSALTILSSMYFDYLFLRNAGSGRTAQILQKIMMLAPFAAVALQILGDLQSGLMLSFISIWISIILNFGVALTLPTARPEFESPHYRPLKHYIIFCYGLIMFVIIAGTLPALGVVPSHGIVLEVLIIHGILSATVLSILLGLDARTMIFDKFNAVSAFELQKKKLEIERTSRREQARFISMLSHEIKSPLSVIQFALASPVGMETSVHNARRAVGDIDHIIRMCYEVEKIDDLEFRADKQTFVIDEDFIRARVLNAQSERITISAPSDWVVLADEFCLSLILNNLVSNALKYSPDRSPIYVKLESTTGVKNGFSLMVENWPRANSWPDSNQVFNKYYRSEASRHVGGSGLGLYLCHRLCELLGGEIRYEPSSEFVRFVVWLPN